MNKQEMIEKVRALMQDEQFKAKLSEAEDLEAMAALFRNEGFEITGADLEAAVEQSNGELSEENLENVAGGDILGAAVIFFIGGSILLGYIDGVKKKGKKCGWF